MQAMKRNAIVLLAVLMSAVLISCTDRGETEYNPPAMPKGSPTPRVAPPGLVQDREIAMLKDIAIKEPDNLNAWIKLGNLSMDSKRNQDAIMAYENALRLDPKNTNVMVDMGTCYRRMGNAQKALEIFRQAIEVDPKHSFAHRNAGVVLAFDLRQYDEAIREFETYLKLDPNAPDASNVSGLISELKAEK